MLIPARISQKQIQSHTSQDSATQSYIARKLAMFGAAAFMIITMMASQAHAHVESFADLAEELSPAKSI